MKALDLFAGGGGVSVGLARAGFEVTGVDINPAAEKYWRRGMEPYGGEFHVADALEFPLEGYDLIWASPPCQAYTVSRTRVAPDRRKVHPELIEPIRSRLKSSGAGAWVIENVPGAPLRFAFTLCGASFGLGAMGDDGVFRQLRRHRCFESSMWNIQPPPCGCNGYEKIGVYGNGGGWANRHDPDRRGYKGNVRESREALGIDWMSSSGLSQAIPPAYAEWIGRQAVAYLAR